MWYLRRGLSCCIASTSCHGWLQHHGLCIPLLHDRCHTLRIASSPALPRAPLLRPTDFAQEMKCDGNTMWVCGTFQSDTYAKMFYDAFFRNIVGVQGLGMLGTANDDFCDQYPGSIITVKSYDWGGKYDKNWGSGGQYDWEPTKDTCASCDVDYSFTCPSRPTIQACDVVSLGLMENKE